MKTRSWIGFDPRFWWVLAVSVLAGNWMRADSAEARREGAELAAELCSRPPAEDFSWRGVLIVRDRARNESEVPFKLDVQNQGGSWRSSYEAAVTNGGFRERLVVIHDTPAATRYLLARAKTGEAFGELHAVPGNDLHQSFAQTDFSLMDLGLDFFRWPQQTVLSNTMRRGRSCKVLQSAPAAVAPTGYSRVVSWVDRESGGLLNAEAYDYQNRRLKVFSVHSFRKVKERDRYELEEMEIRNVLTGSLTTLKFDLSRSGPTAPVANPSAEVSPAGK